MLFDFFRRSAAPASAREARERAAQRVNARDAADPAALRQPARPQDLLLSALAQVWVGSLADDERPGALLRKYPRIANRLALCWDDPALLDRVFDDLLVDRRGGRRGFPPDVQADLLRLRASQARRQALARVAGLEVNEVPFEPWSLRTLAIGELRGQRADAAPDPDPR
jgi:hypothetical protein